MLRRYSNVPLLCISSSGRIKAFRAEDGCFRCAASGLGVGFAERADRQLDAAGVLDKLVPSHDVLGVLEVLDVGEGQAVLCACVREGGVTDAKPRLASGL